MPRSSNHRLTSYQTWKRPNNMWCACIVLLTWLLTTVAYAQPTHQHMLLEQYYDGGLVLTLFGYHFDKQITPELYYSVSIKGAVQGTQRGGYGLASAGLGWRSPICDFLGLDFSAAVGSGGGGAIAAGGGLSRQVCAGAYVALGPEWRLVANAGRLDFPTGTFQALVYNVGVDFVSQRFLVSDGNIADVNRPPQVQKNNISLESKSYFYQGSEVIALYGVRVKRYFSEDWYWGEAGYGALGGQRAGYIEGGIAVGHTLLQFGDFLAEASALLGAAGGGLSAIEGEGLLLQPALLLAWQSGDLSVQASVGYEEYLNGDISSPCWGLGISKQFWSLH